MLRRVSHSSPPQDCAFLNDVVQPALSDLRRSDVTTVAIVGQGAQKGECSGDVVVGDDQRYIQMLVDIVVDLAKLFVKHFIGPPFEGPAQIDANQFAQYAGIDSFCVVDRNGHIASPVSCSFYEKNSYWPVPSRLVDVAC